MITVENVCYSLPSQIELLHNINLTISRDEKIAICGNNGSGKTTLALLLAGVLEASNGAVYRSTELTPGSIQILFQNPTLQALASTVREELMLGPTILKWDATRAKEVVTSALGKLHIGSERVLTTLSGGELQATIRTAIEIITPQLMIYDEPAMYLSPVQQRALLQSTIGSTGAVIWLTPDWREARLFPRVVILHRGRILFDGSASEFEQSPESLRGCGIRPMIESEWLSC